MATPNPSLWQRSWLTMWSHIICSISHKHAHGLLYVILLFYAILSRSIHCKYPSMFSEFACRAPLVEGQKIGLQIARSCGRALIRSHPCAGSRCYTFISCFYVYPGETTFGAKEAIIPIVHFLPDNCNCSQIPWYMIQLACEAEVLKQFDT